MSLTGQNYYADDRSLKKEFRMFTLSDELMSKISGIPGVIDNLESESTKDALSANQGRVLKELIDDIVFEIDDHLSLESENAVQNKVITEALSGYALLGDVNTRTFFMDWTKLPNDPINIEVANEVVEFMNDGGKALIEYGPLTYVAHNYPIDGCGDKRYAFYSFDTFSLSNWSVLDLDILEFKINDWEVTDIIQSEKSVLTIDEYLDAASHNPVANAAIVLALAGKANISYSDTAPLNPHGWDLWFNPTTGDIKYYNWTEWTWMWWAYDAWDGINISSNTISVNAADLPWYWLLEDGNNNLAVDPSIIATQEDLEWKQDTLTAGDHITIVNNKISAVNFQEPLVAWTNIQIDPATNVISATDTKYQAWTRITIDQNNVISADISGVMTYMWNVTSPSQLPTTWNQWDCWYSESDWHLYAWDWTQWKDIGWTWVDLTNYFNKQTDTTDNITEWNINKFVTIAEKAAWNAKQDPIIAWQNITIGPDWRTINAVIPAPITYQAWSWIDITNNVISNTKQFNPGNWTVWQILRKTNNGYEWSDEQWGWGGGRTPNDWTLTIRQGSNSWTFTADQAWNTTVNLESSSTSVNVSNTPYWTAWKNKTNSAPSQNAVYDAIENVKSSIPAPGDWVLTLKQWWTTLWTFSANAKQDKTIALDWEIRYITKDTNLWELDPGLYIIGDPYTIPTDRSKRIKLFCKEPTWTAYEWVDFFYVYYWGKLSLQYHGVNPDGNTWIYYNIIDGWYLNYWYAQPTKWTYRQVALHQNDPYQLWKVSWDINLNFHESTNFSMIMTWNTTIHFWDVDPDPTTAGATPWHVTSILIMQEWAGAGTYTLSFDETNVKVYKVSWWVNHFPKNSIARVILEKQDFWSVEWTSKEVEAKHSEDPSTAYSVWNYYFASVTQFNP